MRRYERASTLLTSNRPVEDWGKLLGDVAGGHRHARSHSSSRPRAQVAKLAHENGCWQCAVRVARRGGSKIEKEEPLIERLGDSVPKPLGFIAFTPEWLVSGVARRRPAIPAPGSALGSHAFVATYPLSRQPSIAGMLGLDQQIQKLLAAPTSGAVQQTSGPGRGPLAGFEVTLYGRICGDHPRVILK